MKMTKDTMNTIEELKTKIEETLDEFIGGDLKLYLNPKTVEEARANQDLNVKVQELKAAALSSLLSLLSTAIQEARIEELEKVLVGGIIPMDYETKIYLDDRIKELKAGGK